MSLRYLLAIVVSLLAILCALLVESRVLVDPGPSLSSEASDALEALNRRLDAMDQTVKALQAGLAAAHSSKAESVGDSGEPEWLHRIESELAELEQAHSVKVAGDHELRARWLSDSRLAREAMEGYQQVFLRTDLSGKVRGQALELLARFPADARALNDAVMAEVRRLLVHQQDGAGLHGAVTFALTKHDHPFAREMLLHVARFGPVERVRAVALRGMVRWKDDPEVATLLKEKMNSGSEQERMAAMRGSGRTIPRSGPKAKERELLRGGK